MNIIQILCTQVCKWKLAETCIGMREGIKENEGGDKEK
jgi:hypothetical protein